MPTSLSRQISYLTFAFATVLVLVVGSFGWWAAASIDDRSMARQSRAILRGLSDVMARVPVEQDSSAIWDDAVINMRAENDAWIAENLAEWMSEYFGHDRVYLLDADDALVRAVSDGQRVDDAAYGEHEAAIRPLVADLRQQMADASAGLADSTAAITGLGVEDIVVIDNRPPAIVSIRPIVPGTDAVAQAPGTEYLHVSLRFLGPSTTREISERYEIEGLTFQPVAQIDNEHIASPVMNANGRIVGFFSWIAEEPAYNLIAETLPVVAAALGMGGFAVFLLVRRLKRTSVALEDTQAHASFLAFHDPMTRLPNRALFEDRLEQALANMRSGASRVALHYVDLDNFKRVNDSLGHAAGDDLLRQCAERLTSLITEVDTVARLGGDEFAVIQFHAPDTATALTLSQRIVEAFAAPFDLGGHESRVGASVGVAIVADPSTAMEDIMRQADVALYEAKNGGRGRYQSYDGDLKAAVMERRELETELRAALNGTPGLELVYQPIFRADSGAIAGAEALVRWNHPTRGRMSPLEFIALAEERGLIDQLGLWVMQQACAYAVSSSIPWVAVNVSPLQFRDEAFADRVFEILKRTGLKAQRLEIEITEGLLLQNSPLTQATLMRLRASGIRVALDDFGTGYSSISYLRTHGIDKLKIDQSYTAQLGQDTEIDSIVRSIIDLGRAMHMAVTAEGVETEAQRALLNGIGCDQLQGYLLSRPVSPARLDEILAQDGSTRRRKSG
ncbi:MAG TPA: EAL domain-containing protein [Devosia sp.]|jgi:diguanylate cyclase (GGDEF)-like protein|nr:EAL domain-containing protein [Devosia sp.]